MGKTTCFSSIQKGGIQDSDQESLAPEDEDEDEIDAYTPNIVQNLTEEDTYVGEDDDDDGTISIAAFKSRCSSIKSVLVSGHGNLCVYVGLTLLFLSATISLILVCLQIVRPYVSVINYKKSDCYVVSSAQDGVRGCMCGIGCNNRYNCIVVTVSYLYEPLNNTWLNATLYEDESLIHAQVFSLFFLTSDNKIVQLFLI